jgi:DNA-binding MarR family transcriptional regulator
MTKNARVTMFETASRLHSVAIHLLRRVRKSDVESGLSPARASALSVLVFGGPRTIGELATAEQVSAPTMTRLVAGLEKDGHLKRSPDPSDGRAVQVRATAKGRRVLEMGRDRRVEQVIAILDSLKSADLRRVEQAVDVLERALR